MENTSAVSARASDLSTMMSSFSPLSRILSMDERGGERDTDVVDHDALDVIELLLDSSGDIGVGIVPLGLRIIAGEMERAYHESLESGGEISHGIGLGGLDAIARGQRGPRRAYP